jgi:hypothetical protein
MLVMFTMPSDAFTGKWVTAALPHSSLSGVGEEQFKMEVEMTKLSVAGAAAVMVVAALTMGEPAFAQQHPEREAYFGETHVHTSWSLDAYLGFDNTLAGPEDFYKYSLGQPITHPGGFTVKITKPLDWGATTEHAEYLGAVQAALDPASKLSGTIVGKSLKFGSRVESLTTYKFLTLTMLKNHPLDDLMTPDVLGTYWKQLVKIADKYYQPGKFTTFAAYEWTSTPNTANLHRNIIFRDTKKVPDMPFSAIDSDDPRELWKWMDAQRKAGNELLAITHNSNLSNGLMFTTETDDRGRPIDKAWAETRMRNEPLAELKQVKGQSETPPGLSPNDEFANYEVVVWQLLGAKADPREHGSYIRQAYKDGLALGDTLGANPYKFGVVSGSDSHSTAVPYRQKNFFGVHGGNTDETPEKRLEGSLFGFKNIWASPAGLSVVWAEENTREAIFAAMQRKETYSTSGVRIKVRLFGGWELAPDLLNRKDWVKTAYAKGVSMGGDLPAPKGKAPSFVVWALKDPDSGNLDRVQIVKGWAKDGQTFEKIYDVTWAGKRKPDKATGKVPPIGHTVDFAKATYKNTIGAVQLKTVWKDPDFDPSLDAFYYARVLEIPTPRWSTIQAVKLGRVPPDGVAATIQERAWTSPIWYTASAEARKTARSGVTVAELKRKGATALGDAELKQLIVGKTILVRNMVTGRRYEILHGADGRRLITAVDGNTPDLEIMGELSHGRQMQYEIRDGKYLVEIAGAPLEVTVYKIGDKYVAARSNEFGYANYEIEAEKE